MKTVEILQVLNELKGKIETTTLIEGRRKEKYLKDISNLYLEYEQIEIDESLKQIYTSLVKKGKELKGEFKIDADVKALYSKIEYYIRYLKAAKADFKGQTSYLNKYIKSFIFTSILFMALSPQYFGFILPAVFFVPIFLGLRGVKSRSKQGFNLSLAVIPVALMTSFIWIRYGLYAMTNYQKAIMDVVSDTGRSISVAKALVTVPPILAMILLGFALLQAYRGYKSKDLFV
ncbi:hypothetical protein SAMN05661008_01962 [Alkalithermobacter thermoalcaliphilus JW-YL-7 = DSM 7308]|uniref:Alpha-glucosidase n=1 Tax=Alkalithermobacter thermoalcaliphilus JW-YL-7 = DSM 7308 TaxID=1121328 RepID=A0A150FS50_CLOPD|nr:hypothetical protein JWYL7_1522 [[Clostridium] paradoxum JW-YL-7 = DSM 7308]SHL38287.1 hypothetical protein SAMN05661008_01962 [[Clostridium] paradoxum JW-YL-7 = DSM 7308]